MKILIDLFCGLGGWTEGFLACGWTAIGFDIKRFASYPGQQVIQDVRTLSGKQFRNASLIVSSPPCEEFSRHTMPWTRKKNPPPPDLSMIEATYRIAKEAEVPFVMENVRGAQRWIGAAFAHFGPFYLWGNAVPAILPKYQNIIKKEHYGPSDDRPSIRAKIPIVLSKHIAEFVI